MCYERNQSYSKIALFPEYKQSLEEKKPQSSEKEIETNKKSYYLSFIFFQ